MKIMKRNRIKREIPPIGTVLHGKHGGMIFKAKIVQDKSSPIGRSIEVSKKKYPSMTAAAMAITKFAMNGWKFWKFD